MRSARRQVRRSRRAALRWLALAVILAGALAAVIAARSRPRTYVIVIEPTPTAPVHILPAVKPEVWVRWPVPFDGAYQRYVAGVCAEYGLDPALVWAVMDVESQYQADKQGDDGQSIGLMQIYASQHIERMDKLGVTDLFDPWQNVLVGCDLLAELIGYGRGIEWALTYYNGGGARADYFDAEGRTSPYAAEVLRLAEEMTEGVQIEETK